MTDNDPLNLALRYLKFRPRSVFEIRKKLAAKKIAEKEIEKVISVLKKNKLLDDAEFAKMWVRDRNLLKPSGTYVLKMELRQKGISVDDFEATLARQDEEALAQKAIALKYREREIEYQKKVSFLQRRGFSSGVISKILKRD